MNKNIAFQVDFKCFSCPESRQRSAVMPRRKNPKLEQAFLALAGLRVGLTESFGNIIEAVDYDRLK